MKTVDLFAEGLIFISYCILSIAVFEIFIKNFNEFKNIQVVSLVILTSMFLMLCALTHLSHIWGEQGHRELTYFCAIVSFITALVTLNMRPTINEALTNRFRAVHLVKDETILDLMSGYNLNIDVKNGTVLSATINGVRLLHPGRISFPEGVQVGNIVTVNENKYRIIHKIYSHINLNRVSVNYRHSLQDYRMFGIDVTSEIKLSDVVKDNNEKRLALCLSTAHEIRTPLSFIYYVNDHIYRNTNEDGLLHFSREQINEFSYNLELLSLTATQLMDAGRILGGYELHATYSEVNIRKLFKRLEGLSLFLNPYSTIKTEFTVESRVPETFITDDEWLWQMMVNFVTNAFKYTSEGYIKIICTTDHNTMKNGTFDLIIKVIDTGIGISPNDIEKVFEMFVDINKDTHNNSKGIGLYTVKRKVQTLGGNCKVYENPESNGTIFEIKFPVRQSVMKLSVMDVDVHFEKKTFLIVEDSNTIIRLLKKTLEGHNIEIAHNGKEALEKMLKKEYDLVFMDLCMPVMGGIEATEMFREKEESLNRTNRQRIAMMSATEIDRPDLFTEKFSKPLKMITLRSLVESLC